MRQDNPPYSNVTLDAALAARLEGMDVVMREAAHAIRDIAAVGALLNLQGDIQPSDLEIVASMCGELAKAGIPVHPRPRLQVYNLLPPVSSDFLRTGLAARYGLDDIPPRPAADLVAICYVFSGSAQAAGYHLLHPAQRQGFTVFSGLYDDISTYRLNRLTAVSPEQDVPDLWADSAYESGARFVATYGGTSDEICSHHFNQAGRFQTLIATEEEISSDKYQSRSPYGFLMREDYRPDISGKPSTLLGTRIRSAVQRPHR